MRQRTLGRTTFAVSELGFGAWGIGGKQWIGADDDESLRALLAAADEGVNFVDTALAYGAGHSERLVGRLLKERPGIAIATKVPPRNGVWPARGDRPVSECYPPEHIISSCEQSLRNLQTERIDLLQLHTWHDAFLEQDSWQEAFFSLKRSGKVRFLGVSVSEHDPDSALKIVASGVIEAVQVLYNIFDPTAADRLFPLCLEHGVGVLARVPLDEGGLTGAIRPDTTFPKGDFRAGYFRGNRRRQVYERVEALNRILEPEAHTVAELALRFCISHDAVSTVIPGMRKISTVTANVRATERGRLSSGLLQELRRHSWPRNFYD
jgi:aryl-alcohol dehydrogenase-like predicted oxidoreductase